MSFLFILILIVSSLCFSQTKKSKKTFAKKISVKLTLSGDLNESYQLDGNIGDRLNAETDNPTPVCQNTSLFREALYRNKKSLEVWLQLNCTLEGQKAEFKLHRIFIDPSLSNQTLTLPAQTEKIKKISAQFSELEIKSNKKK